MYKYTELARTLHLLLIPSSGRSTVKLQHSECFLSKSTKVLVSKCTEKVKVLLLYYNY